MSVVDLDAEAWVDQTNHGWQAPKVVKQIEEVLPDAVIWVGIAVGGRTCAFTIVERRLLHADSTTGLLVIHPLGPMTAGWRKAGGVGFSVALLPQGMAGHVFMLPAQVSAAELLEIVEYQRMPARPGARR